MDPFNIKSLSLHFTTRVSDTRVLSNLTDILIRHGIAVSDTYLCLIGGISVSEVVYKDDKEAYDAYSTYAHNNGFSVRKDYHSFWPNSRKIKSKDFVYSKAKKVMMTWHRNEQNEDYKCSQFEIAPGVGGMSIDFVSTNSSKFAYQISTRAQGNELTEQYMLTVMKDMAENIDLLIEWKIKNNKFVGKSQGCVVPISRFKYPQKRRPKGISNARSKGHWEKKKQKNKIYFHCAYTALLLCLYCALIAFSLRFSCAFIALSLSFHLFIT
ncbi:hypothetical protein M5K25_008275 [Dendrobium thyrsiflorum]|uniref:Uncharacterized protein n=1 Tax=Dendrobium thyrsiflorum TaxID=117978 RepID=A0ABD0VF24_DENTH